MLCAAAAVCGAAAAAPPAYDGKTPMIEAGPLWLDPAMSDAERLGVAESLLQAQANIVAAYGDRLAAPVVVWCKTMACVTFFSGSDGRSYANPGNGQARGDAQYAFRVPALVITRQARYPNHVQAVETLTHEMSHLEFAARLRRQHVPAWFNEGVATYLGGEQQCRPGMRGVDDLTTLDSGARWVDATNESGRKLVLSYCQARNEVAAWIASRGGFDAVLQLLRKRAGGISFERLYGPLRDAAPASPGSLPQPADATGAMRAPAPPAQSS